MSETSFGQPLGAIMQVAYIVEDLHQGMKEYAAKYNIGPWFYTDNYVALDATYRGQPTDLSMKLCLAFSGHMSFELIEVNDTPSVYQETFRQRGAGFHHLGLACADFDADFKKYQGMGYEPAFCATNVRGARIAYFDTTPDFPGMMELIEMTPSQDAFLGKLYEASRDWDGKTDPVRPFSSLVL
ncbi:VOC family protein [Alcaligenaceae bacterium]|nr:VOC family protein [Alcaligenaceae bacterium]